MLAESPQLPEPLVGIARLAAESEKLPSKSAVEYYELPTRSVLNRSSNPAMPFTWTINPYRGCEFGCKYCYARYTHEFMGMEDGRLFETKIYAKQDAARVLRNDLRRRHEGAIALGTATDPYQPAERRFGLTRAILEVFADEGGYELSITTKSDLIVRDVGLLAEVARSNVLSVNMTVTTMDRDLARLLEPRAPRPDLRLRAVERLAEAGVEVGVFANPVMPLISDSVESLSAVAEAAANAGAGYFGGGTLFLMPCAQRQFFPFLEENFPDLAGRYKRRYGKQPYLRGDYADLIRRRVCEVRSRYELASAPRDYVPEVAPAEAQLRLFG